MLIVDYGRLSVVLFRGGRAHAEHSFTDALCRRHSAGLAPAVITEAAARPAIYSARAMSFGLPAGLAEMPGGLSYGQGSGRREPAAAAGG